MLMSFIMASCLITLIPGPSMLIVMMNSIRQGLLEGSKTIIGVVVADAILLTLALSGIGTLLYTSAIAFSVLKWVGVAYLVYLGAKQLITPLNKAEEGSKPVKKSANSFLQGVGVTLLNPKIIGFFVAFFPQFIDPQASISSQLLILGPLFLIIVFAILFMYALFARSVSHFLAARKGQLALKNSAGVALIGCGVLAATVERG
ncbi:LysE family translocator [Motiliproteus sp. MSK22-1]|uniref:LysE family translocator n=1 Tax=Motiliproteus sp. MSK22-1 TaxID=1897630 RepID=UPI00097716F5|nr:LysE family translocator [Motiliproteus sp. MSK22-1]OMH33877.1 threonine transporter [Motiliproteus sp. MSK22-1]